MKKNDDFLKDLHIGSIIKEIALQKGISSKKIVAVIRRYQQNADKIFKINDMDIEDIIYISYLLEYNILEFLVKKYVSHLPCSKHFNDADACLLKIDMRTQRVTVSPAINNCDFLKNIHIGQCIKKIAQQNGWNEQELAKRLHCTQSSVSDLYNRKSLKTKALIQISNLLQYHFIAEIYLPQIVIVPVLHKFDYCMIALNSQQVRIINMIDNTIMMSFERNDDKK
jgi:transcriptional regulator with XRE-family HTH domain